MCVTSYSYDIKGQSVKLLTDYLLCGYSIYYEAKTTSGGYYIRLHHRHNGNRLSVYTTKDKVEVRKNGKMVKSVCLPRKT